MSSEYEKELEVRNEVLASLLTKQNPGEIVYMVDVKPNCTYSGNGSSSIMVQERRCFYLSLNEAFLAYSPDKWADKFENGTADKKIEETKALIDIYEYNIRTGAKTKVFG